MNSINLSRIIDESKFNRFHASVVFWCAFIMIFDGYDLVVYGSVLPVLMQEWDLTSTQAGTLGSAALFGMMLGALIFGPLADKMGRKSVMLTCIAIFSLFTALLGFTNGPLEFGIFRFIAGLGLGGIMPNTVALMTEYSPKSLKSVLVSVMFSGYSVGGMMAAGFAIVMMGQFGWRSLFFVGILPLLLLPIMYKTLPESPRFLLIKNQPSKLDSILRKVEPLYTRNENQGFEQIKSEPGATVAKLFKNGRAFSTVMFWITFFMCLLMIYGLNTWLPNLMTGAGLSVGSGLMFLFVLNFGAVLGAIFGGWMADKWDPRTVLIVFFISAGVSLTLIGFLENIIILNILVGIAGASTIGTQIICNSYISQYYPTEMRSSGLGWALGIGRLGAIAGPLMGGFLFSMSLPYHQNFLVFAIPGIIGAITLLFVQEKYSARKVNESFIEEQSEISNIQ
ncbi:MFS transporter [Metabacillus litoralis]|uniref:MFS transporter n=1 Tax=Metabacillus litoralis TaxID=152268 RepID=UPI00203F6382|nr:aromatic acid/H+ symport family MFS transporter [Metabacillus litoralis]MCM3653409.1 aromatic acid/H+ symport family MFS transporter [Metabacillus litoralis]